jgi:hypothetical protein
MRTAGITKPISLASERRSALICSVRRSEPSGALTSGSRRIAELDLEVVDLERGRDRLVGRRAAGRVAAVTSWASATAARRLRFLITIGQHAGAAARAP